MGKIIFILGGARSGKSSFSVKLASGSKKKVAFIATGQAGDYEMKKRILLHKRSRPEHFVTIEEAYDLSGRVRKDAARFDIVIIDCLTLFISNLMLKKYSEEKIIKEINDLLLELRKIKAKTIIVSNEVGLGVVPRTRLGRDFRDMAGKVNQTVAKAASSVFFMVSGLPMKVK